MLCVCDIRENLHSGQTILVAIQEVFSCSIGYVVNIKEEWERWKEREGVGGREENGKNERQKEKGF